MIHAQALRLQCGGLGGLQQALGLDVPDVHRMIGVAHQRHTSLTELPWDELVHAIVGWRGRARRAPAR